MRFGVPLKVNQKAIFRPKKCQMCLWSHFSAPSNSIGLEKGADKKVENLA
jgi:hypothetical protein